MQSLYNLDLAAHHDAGQDEADRRRHGNGDERRVGFA